jgi:hypothetical protein
MSKLVEIIRGHCEREHIRLRPYDLYEIDAGLQHMGGLVLVRNMSVNKQPCPCQHVIRTILSLPTTTETIANRPNFCSGRRQCPGMPLLTLASAKARLSPGKVREYYFAWQGEANLGRRHAQ